MRCDPVEYIVWLVAGLTAGAVIALAGYVWVRRVPYRRQLNYSPRADYTYRLEEGKTRLIPLVWDSDGFTVAVSKGVCSAFLKVRVVATWLGVVTDPYLEIECGGRTTRQYFERGVSGIRFLNLSRFVGGETGKVRVCLRGCACRWHRVDTTLYAFRESLKSDERVVVVAPHPDDAEIAAFGVYSTTDAVVVTV